LCQQRLTLFRLPLNLPQVRGKSRPGGTFLKSSIWLSEVVVGQFAKLSYHCMEKKTAGKAMPTKKMIKKGA